MTVQNDRINEDNKVEHPIQSLESKAESLVSNRCGTELDPKQTLTSNIRSSGTTSSCRELFFPSTHGFRTIPKHITTSDEKYVLRCLELIRDYALRAEAWTLTSKVRILPDDLTNLAASPMVVATDEIVNSSSARILGRITNTRSMMNILKSPLLRQFGSIDFDAANSQTNPACNDTMDFRHKEIRTLSDKSPKVATVVNTKPVSKPMHRRLVSSISSTNSSCSDQSSSSASVTSFQGMLQCTWKNGLPRHVFSVDENRETYVADSYKVESSGNKGFDYVYNFRLRKMHEKELDSMAMMHVSTSILFCPDHSEVRETQFILSVPDNWKMQVPNPSRRKNKSLIRSCHSYKQKISSAIFEDTPWDPSEVVEERSYAPNHELAAIVVKDVSKNCRESDTGGWGLRFLKESRSYSSEHPTRNTGDCLTSMDVLIPAALHGGPKPRSGGPSSLVERWISGGRCDCGGWDIGCPLTILSTEPSSLDRLSHVDNSEQCKLVDLFAKGSKLEVPALKMVNIHEGLFYIHFQSNLSSLQSFAIAAAIIHSRSRL